MIFTDSSYEYFYQEQDYPVVKYLREPLYFEVALESTDSKLELILENCWATTNEDRTSTPSWDIIVDGLVSTQELTNPEFSILVLICPLPAARTGMTVTCQSCILLCVTPGLYFNHTTSASP